jgi:hypothetical protein
MNSSTVGVRQIGSTGLNSTPGTPVVLRDPVSGEVTRCVVTGAFPLINQLQCVASHENMGWMRTTGAGAQHAAIAAVREEYRAARVRGELKTYAAARSMFEFKC